MLAPASVPAQVIKSPGQNPNTMPLAPHKIKNGIAGNTACKTDTLKLTNGAITAKDLIYATMPATVDICSILILHRPKIISELAFFCAAGLGYKKTGLPAEIIDFSSQV